MRTNIFKVVSIVLSVMLSLQNVSFAGAVNVPDVLPTPNGLEKIYIPESYGSIELANGRTGKRANSYFSKRCPL